MKKNEVAPFVGAWIEIYNGNGKCSKELVAPFVGAWIEIPRYNACEDICWSLRSSERGLK